MTTLQTQASDPNNDPLTYSWSVDGEVVTNSGRSLEFRSESHSVGSHTIGVAVTDIDSLTANCQFILTIDRRPNGNPSVELMADKNEAYDGDTVTVTAQANDPDGDPVSYSWSLDGQSQSWTKSSIEINTAGLGEGRHSVSVTVRDDRKGTATHTALFSLRERAITESNEIFTGARAIGFAVQVAAYRERQRAEALQAILQNLGYPAYMVEEDIPGSGRYHRVRVGPFSTSDEAAEVASEMGNRMPEPLPNFWIVPYQR